MARLIAMALLLITVAGCSGPDAGRGAPATEAVPPEVEERYQNREALKYGLDLFEREAEARARLGLPVPDWVQSEGRETRRPGP